MSARNKIKIPLGIVVALIGLLIFAYATPSTALSTVAQLPQPVKDSTIDSINVNWNGGALPNIYALAENSPSLGVYSGRALLEFDVSSIPVGSIVNSVNLRLYSTQIYGASNLRIYRVTSSWTEIGLTWANQPSVTTTYVESYIGSSGYWAPQVTSLFVLGSTIGFEIRSADENTVSYGDIKGASFASKEQSNTAIQPQLEITYTPPSTPTPTPTTSPTSTYQSSTSTPAPTQTITITATTTQAPATSTPTPTPLPQPETPTQATYNTATLIVANTEGGTTNPTPGTYTYSTQDTLNLTATPNEGYYFRFWYSYDGAKYTDNPLTLPMSQSQSLTAIFEPIPEEPVKSGPLNATQLFGLGLVGVGAVDIYRQRRVFSRGKTK